MDDPTPSTPDASPAAGSDATPEPVRLIYITSLGHSGSTLLDMLISSHSQAMTVGELHQFNRTDSGQCACGAESYDVCPFWQRVDTALQARHNLALRDLQTHSEDDAIFRHHNLALLQTLQALTGVRYFVDSSKKVDRLRQLIAHDDIFHVIPIHLIRRAQGVVYSNIKKGRPWLEQVKQYCGGMRSRRLALRGIEHIEVQYEDLCRDPAKELDRIMTKIGLPYEPAQLEWTRHEHHNVNGNKGTRSSTDATIRLDEKWRRKLWLHQKLIIEAIVRADERQLSKKLKGS